MKGWIAEAKARCKAATAGPWEYRQDAKGGEVDPALVGVGYDDDPMPITTGTAFWSKSDFAFIAAARTDLPRALGLLERATRLLESASFFISCNEDGECRGCALDAEISVFIDEATDG